MRPTRPSFPLLAQDVHSIGVVEFRKRCYSELVVGGATVGRRVASLTELRYS
jgi:hypothetical protein